LRGYQHSMTPKEDAFRISLQFSPTNYYTFLATVGELGSEAIGSPPEGSLRVTYLGDVISAKERPIPFLAQGFGIIVVVLTSDNYLIFHQRRPDIDVRPGEIDLAVIEAINPFKDRSDTSSAPDLYRAAARGVNEEVCKGIVERDDVTLLGFAVDLKYYQWNVVGLARSPMTYSEIIESRSRGVEGKWEMYKLIPVKSDPISSLSFLRDQEIWDFNLLALYWFLVKVYGRKEADYAVNLLFSENIR
jgi:hypothetical protein